MTRHMIAAWLLCVLVAVALAPAYAEVLPPLKQLESGVPLWEIRCNGDRVLVIRDGGSPACVYAATAERTGWQRADAGGGSDVKDTSAEHGMTQHAGSMQDEGSGTGTVTLYGTRHPERHGDMEAPRVFAQPWTTLSYPESFELGKPFAINYTWSFSKTFSELHGDEYPPGNPGRYPWAWGWNLDSTWEDGDGNTSWRISTGKSGHDLAVIEIGTDYMVHLLNEEYTDGVWYQDEYRPHPSLAKRFIAHPHNEAEENTGNFTLRIDEPILPRRDFPNAHQLQIGIGLDDSYPLYVHFDGNRGHIGTKEVRFFDSGRSAGEILENPYRCLTEEQWDEYTHDEKRHMITYDTFTCPSGTTCPDCAPTQTTEGKLRFVKEWLDGANVTENIRQYLTDTLPIGPDLMDEFFEKYPELAGRLTLFPHFLPDAYASHGGDHLLFAHGHFRITDDGGSLVSPVGMKVCLFDRRNDGSHDVLSHGNEEACEVMSSPSGRYGMNAVNDDPDGGSGVDLVVGLRAENDAVRVVEFGNNPRVHGTGDLIEVYQDEDPISVPNTERQIVRVNANLGPNGVATHVHPIMDKISDAYEKLEDEFGADITQVTVEYDMQVMRHGNHYHHQHSTISLNDDAYNRDFLVLHEYGHHVMRSVYLDENNGGWPTTVGSNAHHIAKTHQSEGLVWKEGWADYLPLLVRNSPSMQYYGTTYDFEDRTYGASATPFDKGPSVEGNVAAILWDLTDGTGEPGGGTDMDDVSGLERAVWDVLDSPAPSAHTAPHEDFDEFVDQWRLDFPHRPINRSG